MASPVMEMSLRGREDQRRADGYRWAELMVAWWLTLSEHARKLWTETGGPTQTHMHKLQSTPHKHRRGKFLFLQTRLYVLRLLCEESTAQTSSLVSKIVVRMQMREHEGPTCGRRTTPSSSPCRTKGNFGVGWGAV